MTPATLLLKRLLFAITAILLAIAHADTYAQELNCQVTVDYSQVQGTNTSVFTTLQEAIADYINTRKWTNAQFSPNEKIECKFFLTVKKYLATEFPLDILMNSSSSLFISVKSNS